MGFNYGKAILGRITFSGLVMLFIFALLVLSAMNTGENLLYIVFSGVFGMLFLSVLAARWSLRRVTVYREAPYAVCRGESFAYTAHIANRKRFVPALSLRIEQQGNPSGYVMYVPAGHEAAAAATTCFQKRGVYRLPPCDLVTAFPFGFLELRRRYRDDVEVLVYPRIRPARMNALERASTSQFVPSRIQGEGDEYFALREYIRGDDLRLVVWRVSARLGTWMVREMGVGNTRIITFVLDTRRVDSPDFEDTFEEIIEITASLMITLLNRQYEVGLLTPTDEIAVGRGAGQEQRILDCMARIVPVESDAHPDFEEQIRRRGNEQSRLVYLSVDPAQWKKGNFVEGVPALDPGDVIYA
ncbi:MAG: DUF58 domain-containing protein [Candidatus Hydrogenedentes bacterium]|nr:DUF58 domain-containing protein [Candidatus Hydrogenedentota bacterium]